MIAIDKDYINLWNLLITHSRDLDKQDNHGIIM